MKTGIIIVVILGICIACFTQVAKAENGFLDIIPFMKSGQHPSLFDVFAPLITALTLLAIWKQAWKVYQSFMGIFSKVTSNLTLKSTLALVILCCFGLSAYCGIVYLAPLVMPYLTQYDAAPIVSWLILNISFYTILKVWNDPMANPEDPSVPIDNMEDKIS